MYEKNRLRLVIVTIESANNKIYPIFMYYIISFKLTRTLLTNQCALYTYMVQDSCVVHCTLQWLRIRNRMHNIDVFPSTFFPFFCASVQKSFLIGLVAFKISFSLFSNCSQ